MSVYIYIYIYIKEDENYIQYSRIHEPSDKPNARRKYTYIFPGVLPSARIRPESYNEFTYADVSGEFFFSCSRRRAVMFSISSFCSFLSSISRVVITVRDTLAARCHNASVCRAQTSRSRASLRFASFGPFLHKPCTHHPCTDVHSEAAQGWAMDWVSEMSPECSL